MVWKLNINGRIYKEKKLQKVLEGLKHGKSVTVVHQGRKFKVTKIEEPYNWYCKVKWRIDFLLKNRPVFVINALSYWFEVPYTFSEIQVGRGWLKIYGEGRNPINECELGKLDRNLTILDKYENGSYTFAGNHKEFAGAFRYIVWSKNIIKKLKEILKEYNI